MYERGGGRSSISTGKSAYYMIKVLLALMMGLARRRPLVERGRSGARRRGASGVMALFARGRSEPRSTGGDHRRRRRCWLMVLEMVRRRRLMERYALLWVLAAIVLIGLAAWPNGLKVVSDAAGIFYPPTRLFIVAFVFVLLLLLHFSAAVSRLGDQTKVLAQRAALLEQRLRRLESAEGLDDPELEVEPDYAVLERESARRH